VDTVFYRPPGVSMFAQWAFDRLAYLGCEIVYEPIAGRARMVWWVHGVTDRDVPIARADRVRDVAVEIGEPVPLGRVS
jgi:hypothetical protein